MFIENFIYIKIYITLIIIILMVSGVTWSLANSDSKRSDLWFKIAEISMAIVAFMIIVGILISIWFLD